MASGKISQETRDLYLVKIHTVVFSVLIQCSLVGYYQEEYAALLKMEAVCSSETLVATYLTTGCHNPQHEVR